jgi:hypothetical protein
MKPLIVTGQGRNGTTITAKLLDSHPQIKMTTEKRVIQTMLMYLKSLSWHNNVDFKTHPDQFSYVANNVGEWVRIRNTIAENLRRAVEEIYYDEGVEYFGDKYAQYLMNLPYLRMLFPDYRMIIPIRKREAVLKSFMQQPWVETGWMKKLSIEYERFKAIIEKIQKEPNVLVIELEALQANPKKVCKEMAQFLELEDKFNTELVWK